MEVRSTWQDVPESAAGSAILLTYVLDYDDLLADGARVMRIPFGIPAVTMGRAEDGGGTGPRGLSDFRVADKWASGRHAVMKLQDGSAVLHDDGSRNGVYVNGVRTREQALTDGDLIEVGHSLLCYRQVDERLAAALGDEPEPVPRLGPTRTCSPEMARVARDLAAIARSREPVLLLGETGAGKEIAALSLHERSGRTGAFVAVDCGAVPESLFESTFFGHVRGAFTGAAETRKGEIVRADGGTLFLDEVANMSPACQAKLLRVLEDGKVRPVGAADPQHVEARWVAATNEDVFADEARFRQDLLRRLAGCVGRIPPLRARREDLGILAAHLLRQAGLRAASITAAAGRKLFNDPFSGNVRQLRATLRSAATLATGQPIGLAHLASVSGPSSPAGSGATSPRTTSAPPAGSRPRETPKTRPEVDRAVVEGALERARGNVVHAAKELETHARQVYRWIDRWEIPLDRYRR